ncbi:hypothetical protein PMZ80_005296 [Knufia obscura]|uniref:Uncharacterized protein n=1 Tax=Knufia obscura TaxID=1635080 RepID=A0ABR0RQ58_9EURO|nr:hypothetical protein PMZ80_005296 [Knufia obscura]
MAYTRCANPEYQLDVDSLMIEYTVYKAVEAQLRLLRSLGTPETSLTNGALDAATEYAQEAVRLTETYDILIKLFKRNHGHDHLGESLQLDAHVLQFLVLLNMWLQARLDGTQLPQLQIGPEMEKNLRRDQEVNQFFRYYWLRMRERKDPDSAVGSAVARRNRNPQLCLADHLIPHFMHLSCKMQPSETSLDTRWMELASTFMMHAAIEILDAPDLFEDGVKVAILALKECLAWGFVERHRFVDNTEVVQRLLSSVVTRSTQQQISQTTNKSSQSQISQQSLDMCTEHIQSTATREDDVWEMFYDEGSDRSRSGSRGRSTPQSSGELSQWTRIRQEKLDIVLTTFATIQEESDGDKHRPVEWLRNKYKLSTLIAEIGRFIEMHLKNVHGVGWHGKPVLVQIEEGGLHGLSSEAFEAFKIRAGIANEQWLTGASRC